MVVAHTEREVHVMDTTSSGWLLLSASSLPELVLNISLTVCEILQQNYNHGPTGRIKKESSSVSV